MSNRYQFSSARAAGFGAPIAALFVAMALTVTLIPAPSSAASQPAENQDQQKAKSPSSAQSQSKDAHSKDPQSKDGQPNDESKKNKQEKPAAVTYTPAEAIVETTILVHGGRAALKTARGAIREEGTIRLASDSGEITGSYLLRSIRKDKSWEDLLRTDLELAPPESPGTGVPAPTVKYILSFNGASVWGARNNQYITPQPQTEQAFKAQLTHDYNTLLRYKEDGSKVELVGPETVVGIDTNIIELTTPNGDKSRFWISTKTYRILHLEYELKLAGNDKSTKFRVSYYPPLKAVQNTLVPARRVTTQDGKFVQEVTLTQVVYSAKLNPEIFQYLQSE